MPEYVLFIYHLFAGQVFVRHLPWLHIWGRTASRTFVFPAFMEYPAVLPVTQPGDFWVIAWCSCCFSFASVLCTLVNTLWNPARCSCNREPVLSSLDEQVGFNYRTLRLCGIWNVTYCTVTSFNCCLHINTKSHCSTDERWWSLSHLYFPAYFQWLTGIEVRLYSYCNYIQVLHIEDVLLFLSKWENNSGCRVIMVPSVTANYGSSAERRNWPVWRPWDASG